MSIFDIFSLGYVYSYKVFHLNFPLFRENLPIVKRVHSYIE